MNTFTAKTAIIVSFVILTISGCATSYQAKGLTGGFTETRVSENTYQVNFEGNNYTSQEKTSQFILRRAAELTLEDNERYFVMTSSESQSTTSGYNGMMFSAPSGKATVRILDSKEEAENPFDAVIVVEETNEVAGGQLSEKAQKTYRSIKSQ